MSFFYQILEDLEKQYNKKLFTRKKMPNGYYRPRVFRIFGSDFSVGLWIGEKLQLRLGVDEEIPVGVDDLVLGDGIFPLTFFCGGVALRNVFFFT